MDEKTIQVSSAVCRVCGRLFRFAPVDPEDAPSLCPACFQDNPADETDVIDTDGVELDDVDDDDDDEETDEDYEEEDDDDEFEFDDADVDEDF